MFQIKWGCSRVFSSTTESLFGLDINSNLFCYGLESKAYKRLKSKIEEIPFRNLQKVVSYKTEHFALVDNNILYVGNVFKRFKFSEYKNVVDIDIINYHLYIHMGDGILVHIHYDKFTNKHSVIETHRDVKSYAYYSTFETSYDVNLYVLDSKGKILWDEFYDLSVWQDVIKLASSELLLVGLDARGLVYVYVDSDSTFQSDINKVLDFEKYFIDIYCCEKKVYLLDSNNELYCLNLEGYLMEEDFNKLELISIRVKRLECTKNMVFLYDFSNNVYLIHGQEHYNYMAKYNMNVFNFNFSIRERNLILYVCNEVIKYNNSFYDPQNFIENVSKEINYKIDDIHEPNKSMHDLWFPIGAGVYLINKLKLILCSDIHSRGYRIQKPFVEKYIRNYFEDYAVLYNMLFIQ